jgi:DNA-binding NarL/FixJ family response regulator
LKSRAEIKKNRSYLLHPLIWGIVLSVIAIFVLAQYIPKYYTGISAESVLYNNHEIYYSDLNNDGNSEKINYYHYDKIFQPTIYLYDSEDKFKALWNFNESPVKNSRIFSDDYNDDNIKEIFVFTEKSDSLFLYILNSEDDSKHVVERNFVTVISEASNDLRVTSLGLYVNNKNNEKEFYFTVDADYPNKPIKLYAFNISQKSLKFSPDINAKIKQPLIIRDINKDGEKEVLISNQSVNVAGNGSKAQLVLLNHNLKYLFNPVGFQGTQSLITSDIVNINGENYIASLNSGTTEENVFNNLMLFDIAGNRIKEERLSEKLNLEVIEYSSDPDKLILFSGKKLITYSTDLKKVKSFLVCRKEKVDFLSKIDIADDGKPEYLFKSKNKFILVSEDLHFKYTLNISDGEIIILSILKRNESPNQLSIQIDNKSYLIDYYRNDASFYNGILYILVFVIITFLTFIVFKLIRRRSTIIGKVKENIYKEVEDNFEDKISGFKTKIEEIKEEFPGKSFTKALDEIEDAISDVMPIVNESEFRIDINKSLTELKKNNKSSHKINFSLYPEKAWKNTRPDIEKSIIEFCEELFVQIAEDSKKLNINIQMILHKEYVNVLIEAEDFDKENTTLINNKDLSAILEKVNGKYNVDTFAEFGTVINIDIPLELVVNKDKSKTKGKIKVLIAEDHDVSLFGLVSLFKTKDDIEIVGTARNGMEVLKKLETDKVDIVITDISMPGMDGIELSEKLQQDYPNIKIIVFTMYMENWFVEQLLNFGAKGFVSKNSKIIELVGAVRNVYEGNNYYCPQFKSKFGFKNKENGKRNQLDSLTKNELLIIKFYAENLKRDQIAKKMNLNKEIMDAFFANILLKLNAGDEEEIIRIAKKQKFISD